MRVSPLLGRNASFYDFKQLFPRLAGVAPHGETGGAISLLSPAQNQQPQYVLQGETEAVASLEATEAKLAETRQCPHCDTPGAVSQGKARGLRRYQCKACKKTFNAATDTALQGVHKKERWLTYGECLADGLTIRESADRSNLVVSTAFYWRHRFLGAQEQPPPEVQRHCRG